MKKENKGTWIAVALLVLGAALLVFLGIRLALYPEKPKSREEELLQAADQVATTLRDTVDAQTRRKRGNSPEVADADPEKDTRREAEIVVDRESENLFDTESAAEEPAQSQTELQTPSGGLFQRVITAVQGRRHQIIFVGDSRTVGMANAELALGDDCIYIGESGEGYLWFAETGIHLMSDAIRDYPEAPVVINLGVNDTDAIDSYLELYRTFPEIWPDTDFYFLSVNPVTQESEHVHNSDILLFNARMRSEGPFPYLDSFAWMILHRFECVDGVHYSEKTYGDIHDFVVSQLSSIKKDEST